MKGVALVALLSHWRRQPIQLVTLVLGLALATALWSAVQAINSQARASYQEATEQLASRQYPTLTSASGAVDLADYVALRRAGWQLSPYIEGRVTFGEQRTTILGVDLLSYPIRPDPLPDQPSTDPVDILTFPGRLFAHPETAEKLENTALPAVMVTSQQVPLGIVLMDLALAERLMGKPGTLSGMLVLPDQPAGLAPLKELAPELDLQDPDLTDDISALTDSFHLNLTAFGLLSFAVGLFIVHGTVGLAFQQRRGMFRTLRALGLSLAELSKLVLIELLCLAFISGSLGLILGYLVAAALLPDVAASLRGLYGAQVSGVLALQPGWVISGLAMAFAGALVAGGQSLFQLHQLPILAATGPRSWSRYASRRDTHMFACGLTLILLGLTALWIFDGLLAGFILLAGIMLGSALLLPAIVERFLVFFERQAKTPIAQWVWAELRSHMPSLSLALMALLLAIATNIGVGTMVSSFRLTFTGWLDQRLASELYVTARTDREGEAIFYWLTARGFDALPIRSTETRINGQSTTLYGIIDHATYRDLWPLVQTLPDVWGLLHRGNAVLINEQLAYRFDLSPGDTITLKPGWSSTIAGIYSDYGNPTGQALVSLPNLLSEFTNIPNRQFGVRVAAAQSQALADSLRNAFDLPVSQVLHQHEIKKRSLAIFEKTFVVTSALNILTLAVAGFAVLTSLLTLWTFRLPQLAPVWALGVTRKQLARLEVIRSIALTAVTAILGLPLGLVLAWCLLEIINVEAFGWRLPMHLFPMAWLKLGLWALFAGTLASLIPAKRLSRASPAELLKVFKNDY